MNPETPSTSAELLNDLIEKHSKTEGDLQKIIIGLRKQRELFERNQAEGSRKRVTTKNVEVSKTKTS